MTRTIIVCTSQFNPRNGYVTLNCCLSPSRTLWAVVSMPLSRSWGRCPTCRCGRTPWQLQTSTAWRPVAATSAETSLPGQRPWWSYMGGSPSTPSTPVTKGNDPSPRATPLNGRRRMKRSLLHESPLCESSSQTRRRLLTSHRNYVGWSLSPLKPVNFSLTPWPILFVTLGNDAFLLTWKTRARDILMECDVRVWCLIMHSSYWLSVLD